MYLKKTYVLCANSKGILQRSVSHKIIRPSNEDMKSEMIRKIHDNMSYPHVYKNLDHLLINKQLQHILLCFLNFLKKNLCEIFNQ
jgi:hypothetical protein